MENIKTGLYQTGYDRLFHNTGKFLVISGILLEPQLELIYYIISVIQGLSAVHPDFGFFLACNSSGVGHIFQSLYIWLLPLYITYLTADEIIEDYQSKTFYIYAVKAGKRNYYRYQEKKAVLISVTLIATSLFLNLLLVNIIFHGAEYRPNTQPEHSVFLAFCWNHPLTADIFYILILLYCAALLSLASVSCAEHFRDRRYIYAIIIIIWLAMILQKHSIVYAFQPFCEYGLQSILWCVIEVTVIYGILSLVFKQLVKRNEQI